MRILFTQSFQSTWLFSYSFFILSFIGKIWLNYIKKKLDHRKLSKCDTFEEIHKNIHI